MDRADDELVARFRAGDEGAATELYQRYVSQMLANVRRRLSGTASRGAYDSEGIVQAGFRSFFSNLKKPDFESGKWRIGALLTSIVNRKCGVALRKMNRTVSSDQDDQRSVVEWALAAAANTESLQEFELRRNELFDSILDDETDREKSILACYLDESDPRSLAEIASSCRCSLTTVEATIKRFESNLRERLREDDRRQKS